MKARDIAELGVPFGKAMDAAFEFISVYREAGGDMEKLAEEMAAVVVEPRKFLGDEMRKNLAEALVVAEREGAIRTSPVPCRIWGEGFDHATLLQIEQAGLLPISKATALMPDAHRRR